MVEIGSADGTRKCFDDELHDEQQAKERPDGTKDKKRVNRRSLITWQGYYRITCDNQLLTS